MIQDAFWATTKKQEIQLNTCSKHNNEMNGCIYHNMITNATFEKYHVEIVDISTF